MITLLDQLNHLKQLPRTGWLLAGVSRPESIADHTFGEDHLIQGLSQPLSLERVLSLALIHDVAESILTDLPHRTTEILGKDVKHDAEAEATKRLFAECLQPENYIELWAEYNSATTAEARLVKDADKLEMVHQALCYERRGYINLQDFWERHRWYYPASQVVFEQLCQQSGR